MYSTCQNVTYIHERARTDCSGAYFAFVNNLYSDDCRCVINHIQFKELIAKLAIYRRLIYQRQTYYNVKPFSLAHIGILLAA